MWCKACQQDVPCLPADISGQFHCARCGEVAVDRMLTAPAGVAGRSGAAEWPPATGTLDGIGDGKPEPPASEKAFPAIDDWAVEAALERIGRMLAAGASPQAERAASRWDMPHVLTEQASPSGPLRIRLASPAKPQKPSRVAFALAWTATMFGTTAIACGAVLLAWSSVSFRSELWQMGLPIAMVGAGLLLIGVFLQLDTLRTESQSGGKRAPPRRPTTADAPARPRYRRLSS
jgi:hypothetical protein